MRDQNDEWIKRPKLKRMTALKEAEIIQLVRRVTGKNPLGLAFLGSGMFSVAYKLDFNDSILVLRIGSNYLGFLKDQWAYSLFPAGVLPIPAIIDKGPVTGYFYCFSEYKEGTRMDQLGQGDIEFLLPEIFRIHSLISAVELSGDCFFGFLDPSGRGIYPTWKAALTNFRDWPGIILSRRGERFLDWDQVYKKTFLEEELVRGFMEIIHDRLKFCPEIRGLIHGDFGFDNMLIQNGRVSAVIDWAECRCGDPLYDIASLHCHGGGIDYRSAFKDGMEKEAELPEYFDERIDCYMAHILLCGCWLDAQRGFEEDYLKAKALIRTLGIS